MTESSSIPISVVILTLNEEINVADCIHSCEALDDVHVLDSGSTDRTRELAESAGASIWNHPFESFGAQRNWAIDNIPVRHDWILHLDADERLTPELVAALRTLFQRDPPEAGFYLPNKLMLMGRWLKRCGSYPAYQMRLFHKGRMRFQDHGHGQRELTDGEIGTIDEPYLHYAFSKGVSDWLGKHNRYSTEEAHQAINDGTEIRISDLFSGDRIRRRRAMKRISFRLPMRDKLRVIQLLIIQRGLLEGRAGLMYARLIAIYERMINVKYRLLRRGTSAFETDVMPRSTATSDDDTASSS
ncbi:MAG: glycosyltransferase family 2 protein [Phycisphaerales bacterium]|nr:glycosyltransferase family 2 protein [Phycisphaerales bacterium]